MKNYLVTSINKSRHVMDDSRRKIQAADFKSAAEKYLSLISNTDAIPEVRVELDSLFGASEWIKNSKYIQGRETEEPIFNDQTDSKQKTPKQTPKQSGNEISNPTEEALTCTWTIFCNIVGTINFALGIIGLFNGKESGFYLAIVGFAGGISCLLLGYIIQLLFDCRRHLEKIANK
jgi:hypothetical protein